jgi:predicted RNase H-like nuclease (RuvC/YqgF family)
MLYNYDQNHCSNDEGEVTAPGEQLDHAIDRVTKDAKRLADLLGDQVDYLAKRHELITSMMELEKYADVPLKTLEKRVGLLQQIRAYGPAFANETLERLNQRIACIETINRLEPNGEHAPIKKLRERARLLERATPHLVVVEGALDEDADAPSTFN